MKEGIILIFLVIFLNNFIFTQESDTEKVNPGINQTETQTKTEGQISSEEEKLISLVENNPDNRDYYLRIINYYNNQNKRKERLKYVIKYIQKFGGNIDMYLIMGDDYRFIGDNTRSLISYQQALKIDPTNPNIYNRMGLTLLKLSRFYQAEAAFKAAIYFISKQNKPMDKGVYYNNLGNCYESLRDYEKALKTYRTSLKFYPNFDRAIANIERIKEIANSEGLKLE